MRKPWCPEALGTLGKASYCRAEPWPRRPTGGHGPAFPMIAWNSRPHLSQFAVLVFHDDLILLQFLQLGLSGHLLELQLLPGTFLLLQLLLKFLKGENT